MRIRNHHRRAISELIATLIMIAVTLVAGTAAFGWILLQAGTSEASYGQSSANNVNFLNERFAIVSQSFSAGGAPCPAGKCTQANFWLYNTGAVDFTLFTIQVENLTKTPDNNFFNLIFNHLNFTAYAQNGVRIPCTSVITPVWTNPLPQGFLSNNPYKIVTPTVCPGGSWGPGGHFYLFDNSTYRITMTGLYGNVVKEQITPNG